ncbi:hypothetical protein GPJ56_007779 [Histomonas meleagridis]|uniref:uncharacterized protein n=1 Tax=Histomonas meleagridis TaxID=135588 RepID=UPI0035595BD8|nr:hypothetical protein GPJ56_007779 [Histomonas meleagridis]KAH0798742.1 hypothetical protein GO595_008607 [Histomonas meleagridis]
MNKTVLLQTLTRKKLLDLADNNRKRWGHFTGGAPMMFELFCRKLIEYKITRNPDDAQMIWDAFGVQGKEMQYMDFIQFLQNDKVDSTKSSTTPSPTRLLYALRRKLIDFCLTLDPDAKGFVTQQQVTNFCLNNKVISKSSDLFSILNKSDPTSDGKINYFKLLYELSISGNDFSPSEMYQPPIDETLNTSRSNKSPPVSGSRRMLDPAIFGNNARNDNHIDHESPRQNGARHALDSTIFGEKPTSSKVQLERSPRNLDPSIFGEKVKLTAASQAPSAALNLEGTKDCVDYNPDETISLISHFVNSKFRSLRDCYGSWRGGDRLTWEDIYRGMINDAKTELNPVVIESLVEEFGGDLTLSSFTRFISEGARLNTPEPVKEPPPPLSERDILLNKIANAIKGKQWEITIKNSKNALDLSRNLKKLGFVIKSEEIRETFQELGMKKICEEIKKRQNPPKKRR